MKSTTGWINFKIKRRDYETIYCVSWILYIKGVDFPRGGKKKKKNRNAIKFAILKSTAALRVRHKLYQREETLTNVFRVRHVVATWCWHWFYANIMVVCLYWIVDSRQFVLAIQGILFYLFPSLLYSTESTVIITITVHIALFISYNNRPAVHGMIISTRN